MNINRKKTSFLQLIAIGTSFIIFSISSYNFIDFSSSNAQQAFNSKGVMDCELICPEDVTITCNQDPESRNEFGELYTGEATLLNCDLGETVTYADSTVNYGDCEFPKSEIHRKWTLLDTDSNEIEHCTQLISIVPWDIKKLEFPEDVLLYDLTDCEDFTNQTALIQLSETGSPTLSGLPIFTENGQCMIDLDVSDDYSYMCPDSVVVVRTWKVKNLCSSTNFFNPFEYQQRIKIVNEPPPFQLDCPDDITFSVDPWGCTATQELPIPSNIKELCEGVEFDVEITEGEVVIVEGSVDNDNLTITAIGLEPGMYEVEYVISDDCDNTFTCDFLVRVLRPSPNIAINSNVVVELTSSGTSNSAKGRLYAMELSNSSDPCGPIKLEVRRDADMCDFAGNTTYNADGHPNDGDSDPDSPNYDPDQGEFVEFCCEGLYALVVDVNGDGMNDLGYAKVWLRVWVDSNEDDIPGNEGDDYYETWTFVKVKDKLDPAIVCPPDITVQCIDEYTNPELTGMAAGYSSCGEAPTEYTDIIVNISTCETGFIRRRWNVVERADIFCDQTIIVSPEEGNFDFISEQEVSYDYCPGEQDVPLPFIPSSTCDDLEYNFDSDTTYFEDGVCYQVIREYVIINWCRYEPNNPFWEETADFSDGLAEITQTIKVSDAGKPSVVDCEDKIIAINDEDDGDNDGNTCEAMIVLTNSAIDPDGEFCGAGWLKWQVFVDLWADGTNDLEYSSFLPPFDDDFDDTNGNGISDIYLAPTASGEEISIELPDIEGSMSNHKVYWKVTDGCNNVTACDYDILVVDQTPPEAVCVDTSTVNFSPIDQTFIWAADYIEDAWDNCTDTESLLYSFSDDSYVPSKLVNLFDVENSPIQQIVYVWDEKGNVSSCETVLIIEYGLVGEEDDLAGLLQTDNVAAVDKNEFDKEIGQKDFKNVLYQNYPNPFRNNTSIKFDLVEDGEVRFRFINVLDGSRYDFEVDGKKGVNTFMLRSDMLSGSGVYYYSLLVDNYSETKKMVLIQ